MCWLLGILQIFEQGIEGAQQCCQKVGTSQAFDSQRLVEPIVRMLYDFHRSQTSKKPGSVHATYLLDGVPPNSREPSVNGNQQDGEDVHMQSSPYMSSSMPQGEDEDNVIPYRKIILAREADLEGRRVFVRRRSDLRRKFKEVHS